MKRRSFFKSLSATAALTALPRVQAAVPPMKITRVRVYQPPNPNPLFNQSDMVVTVETDQGIIGIGEGGSRDTLEQCAGRLIGRDPHYIERLWQDMSRSFFYPPGREKVHALGALDLALWDIKGKVHGAPVHALLGGMVRNYCECYNTAGIIPAIRPGMGIRERAQATVEAGYRAFRMGAAETPANTTFNSRQKVDQLYRECAQAREGVGKDGDWCVDFHQRFDLPDALRGCELIASLNPLFVEDPVREEAFREDIPILRRQVKVPIAAGEEWGNRWDFNKLVENHDIDWVRATLPNVGGIHRDDEDRGHLRDTLRGHRAPFYGSHRYRGPGELAGNFLRARADGIQLSGKDAAASARLSRFQKRETLPEQSSRSRRRAGYETAQAGDRNHAAHHRTRPDLFPPGRVHNKLVVS
jgi:L-alanine-DL-glutamate epimerase and related enzymes of enolase superfamily